MDYGNELSSSCVSNGSSEQTLPVEAIKEVGNGNNLETLTLGKLSVCLEKLLIDPDYDYTDAEIVVEDIPVGVHRCILATRSQFFHALFKKGKDDSVNKGKPRYLMSDLVPYGRVGPEAFTTFLKYMYTGKLIPSPLEVSTCVNSDCAHDACGPAINYALELMYASATFQMKELVMLAQRYLLNFVEKALVEDIVPILVAAFHCDINQLKVNCVQRIARSDLDSVSLEKELPYEIVEEIKSLRHESILEADNMEEDVDPLKKTRIHKIHKAIDSDDVELLKLLLEESNTTLDDAYALHYAVAYCDPKIVKEILGLDSADLNRLNPRGYTVIHIAARRKEPSLLVALLKKGASASLPTRDGQTAVSICRKLTRPKDFNESTKQGKKTNKDRICIDILEMEMKRNAVSASVPVSSEVTADDLNLNLDYYENRVAFARLLFPTEARVAMDFADVDSTSPHPARLISRGSNGNLREVDLNETPEVRTRRLQARLQALVKTVETGRHFFPLCSEELDRFLEDDIPDVFFLEKGTHEEQRMKKKRFMELKDDVQKAFDKDMAVTNRSSLSSSSSTSSPKNAMHKVRRK